MDSLTPLADSKGLTLYTDTTKTIFGSIIFCTGFLFTDRSIIDQVASYCHFSFYSLFQRQLLFAGQCGFNSIRFDQNSLNFFS